MMQLFPLCLMALLIFSSSALAQTAGLFARVSSVTGAATLSSGNSSFSLTRGYSLSPGDRVDTRQGGRVVIDLSDGSLVIVHPNSMLTIKDFGAAASVRELFEITLGIVRVKIHHLTGKPNPYRMNSPTASVAVRGTEFDVAVDEIGNTRVDVFEGAVEVGRLDDPSERALIEAGRGVLVRPGNPLQLLGSQQVPTPLQARAGFRRQPGLRPPPPPGPPPVRIITQKHAIPSAQSKKEKSPSAMLSEPQDALLTAPDLPLAYRFNAFRDLHLDAYENPAYGAAAGASEARASMYGTSPQLSAVTKLRENWFAGGTLASATSGGDALLNSQVQPDVSMRSFGAFAARRLGNSSLGVSIENLRMSTASGSFVGQTRLTAGFATRVGRQADMGVFARHGSVQTRGSIGTSDEVGFRLRGPLASKVAYGIGGQAGFTNIAGIQLSTAMGAAGLGFRFTPATLVSVDATSGRLSVGGSSSPYTSIHAAVQQDITKRLFVIASHMKSWRAEQSSLPISRNRYTEASAGWRFSNDWIAQYVFTNDDVFGRSRHAVALRYTFRLHE